MLSADLDAFAAALTRENHTLKRALTDPRLFSGIGNAYSGRDPARRPPFAAALTHRLDREETARLFEATQKTLMEWTERLRGKWATAFRKR